VSAEPPADFPPAPRAAAGQAGAAHFPGEGLRERKKRLMRQLISDTATMMFVERGFDEVRVSEVAAACEVSEKTIYNYFPTKESLILDREEAMAQAIRRALGPGGAPISPIDSVVRLITDQVSQLYDSWDSELSEVPDMSLIHRFYELFERTPALRAAQGDMMERLTEVAAQAMASRAGVDPDDPEPQIAAVAVAGLWRVMFRATRKYSDGTRSPAEVRDQVLAEVRRAARLIDTGLWSFGMAVQGSNGREQLKAAADAASEARKQVLTAIKQAREAWRQVVAEARSRDEPASRPARPGRPERPARPADPASRPARPARPGRPPAGSRQRG
jgi:AcrR family transcriptional regulator